MHLTITPQILADSEAEFQRRLERLAFNHALKAAEALLRKWQAEDEKRKQPAEMAER